MSYEGDSENDETLKILPKPERSDGEMQSPSKNCVPQGLRELFSFRKKKSHAEAGQELQDHSRGSSSSDPPPRVKNLVEESITEQSQPQEDRKPQQSSSSDPRFLTANSVRNGTTKLEDQGHLNQSDPSPSGPIPLPNSSTSSEEHRPNPGGGWAYLSNLFRSIKSWSGRIVYGNESISHHILYGPPSADRDDHPRSDILCGVILVVVLVLVTIAISKSQHKAWPVLPDTYTTYNETENSRGGSKHTCGCILPPSLQTPENPTDIDPNLNICYVPSSQETVTILMFANSTVEARVRDIINIYDLGTTIDITVDEGWNVIQEAHELTVQSPESYNLAPFYPGGDTTAELNAYVLVDDLEGLNPPLSYFPGPPGPYIQMFWLYDCNDCNTCSLERVNSLSRGIVNESWVSCYYYGDVDHCKDGVRKYYNGKCVVYKPKVLSVQFAVKKLLEGFRKLPNITNFRTSWSLNSSINSITLQPDVLYLDSITATNLSKTQLSFLEIQKGSAPWTMLLSRFPSLGTECANLTTVKFHNNGKSLCNLYSNAIGYQRYCQNFTEQSQCLPLVGKFTPDNVGSNISFDKELCPEITSHDVPPYLVTWDISEALENDALNSFLAVEFRQKERDDNSGVCTKTYTNVIRHNPNPAAKGGDSHHSEDIFLESECVNATVDQPSFCWTTGRYHNFFDLPTDDWKQLSNDNWQTNGTRFVCYRMGKQKFGDWFITFFGIMFGWYGTIVLVFFGLFGIWLLFRRRIIKFADSVRKWTATAFVSVWDSCLGGTLGGSKSSVEQVPNNGIMVSSNEERYIEL